MAIFNVWTRYVIEDYMENRKLCYVHNMYEHYVWKSPIPKNVMKI